MDGCNVRLEVIEKYDKRGEEAETLYS